MKKMILLVLVVLLMVFFTGCQESKKWKTNGVDGKQAAEGKTVSNNEVRNSTRGEIDKSEIKTGPFNPQVSQIYFPVISYNRELSLNSSEDKFVSLAKISTRGEVKGIDGTLAQKDLSCSSPDYFQLRTKSMIIDKIYFPIASIAEISGVPGSNIISIENGLRIHLSKELYCNIFSGDQVVNWSDGQITILKHPPILKDSQTMMEIQDIALLLSDRWYEKKNKHPLLKADIRAESGLDNEHIVGVGFYFDSSLPQK